MYDECEPICDWSFDQFGFLIGRQGNTALPLVDTNPALVTPLTHTPTWSRADSSRMIWLAIWDEMGCTESDSSEQKYLQKKLDHFEISTAAIEKLWTISN